MNSAQNVKYEAVRPGDYGPLQRKNPACSNPGDPHQYNCALAQKDLDAQLVCRGSKQKVRALTDLIMQLPAGGTREILSESFLAIINGKGDIKHLRALTMRSARQLRTMYLSGGERALQADIRWRVREFAWESFSIHLYIGPKGLHLDEGEPVAQLNAFLKIDSNGSVWSGETYADADEGSPTMPLTTESVFRRLSEKLLRSLY